MTPPTRTVSAQLRRCRFLSLLLILGFSTLCVGCSSSSTPPPATLLFQTADNGRGFAQTFPRAYFSQSPDGDRDVVLVDEGYSAGVSNSTGPIHPISAIPLRQLVHFRILWNPLHGTQADAPSTTNAIIDWALRTTDRSGSPESLRYQGAGFVITSGGSERLRLLIRNASIEATEHTGNLIDPLGRCSVSGTFTAARNDDLVKTAIADMRNEAADAAPMHASAETGPPPRSPVGP